MKRVIFAAFISVAALFLIGLGAALAYGPHHVSLEIRYAP